MYQLVPADTLNSSFLLSARKDVKGSPLFRKKKKNPRDLTVRKY
jgi:hypothetical protein